MRALRLVCLVGATVGATLLAPATATPAPTCSGTLGIAVHGHHIVADYVTGIGHMDFDWPPQGGVVGHTIAGTGADTPGGPGPGFHFPNGFSPGASFCLLQSQAPGNHLGP